MAGTKEGGLKAAETNRQRYGSDFYTKMGRKGGQLSRNGGFAANPELAREAGRKGGQASRRPVSFTTYQVRMAPTVPKKKSWWREKLWKED